ncbi:MAG: putative ABC transport system permease protein [Candidatus Azotimanducaceae bacterium]|jgi:putative ABC transport system permease protein
MNPALALKLLWRDWRSGELTLLLASLIVAVSTVTTITLFVDRLQQALVRESASFLAADLVIASSGTISTEILQDATARGLQRAETLEFLSMVFAADRAQFASVKAVNTAYPLRGKLIVADEPFVQGRVSEGGPKVGEIWLESRLLPALGVQAGDMLEIGVANLKVGKVLIKEPDRGGGFNSVGPRVLMNMADVAGTDVVQPGSRLSYRYLFAGDRESLADFSVWVKPQLDEDARLFGVKDGTERIGSALARAERFLLLGGLLGVLLAGVAIALSAQRYSLRHYDHVAIMKTLGASPGNIDSLFLVIFVTVGLFSTLVGSVIGFGAQSLIASILAPFIPIELPSPGWRPIWLGLVTGMVCLLSFALPPLLKLRATEPARVIRRDLAPTNLNDRLTYGAALLGTIGLMWWYSQDLWLTGLLFSGGAVAVAVLGVVAYALLRSSRALGMQAGSAWRLALAGMQRRGQENTLQILVFGLAIMLLLILFLVRTALIDEWQAQIPADAPNHFALNIAPRDVEPIAAMLSANQINSQPLYPMIRGRISVVNGVPAKDYDDARERQQAQASEAQRDDGPRSNSGRNLTWSATLPAENEIVAGDWWPADYQGEAMVSLEEELANSNGLLVGDELEFTIQGRGLKARVASIRTVSWDNMQPNFYIIFSPGALVDFPSTFMTSFYLSRDQKLFLNDLIRAHPTMTVIEVDAIIEQIQTIISQVTLAIELVLVLIMVAGGMVLLASIQASMDERFQQHAILRTLGASQRLVMGSLVIEFCMLGLFAGVLATVGAEITVFALQTQVFNLSYAPNPLLWLMGPMIGALLIGTIGTVATRKVVRTSPTIVLRDLT